MLRLQGKICHGQKVKLKSSLQGEIYVQGYRVKFVKVKLKSSLQGDIYVKVTE